MAKKKKDEELGDQGGEGTATTAKVKPRRLRKALPKRRPPEMLPPWKVLLHNDDRNSFEHVIESIVQLTPLDKQAAQERTKEAHETGVALLLTTHKERAELYKEQLQTKSLVVSIEPSE